MLEPKQIWLVAVGWCPPLWSPGGDIVEVFGWGCAARTENLTLCHRQRHILLWRKSGRPGLPRALKCLHLILNNQEIFSFASIALFCDSNFPKQAHQKLYTMRTRDRNEPWLISQIPMHMNLVSVFLFNFQAKVLVSVREYLISDELNWVNSNTTNVYWDWEASMFWNSELNLNIFVLFESKANQFWPQVNQAQNERIRSSCKIWPSL